MDIGKQQRTIQVEPEPLSVPLEAPVEPVAPDVVPEEVPAGA